MSQSDQAKIKIQKFGAFLSGMVMPNIGAFIAWGFLTALFIPTGWLPNEYLGAMVGPTITYLLPVLIGYTGGYNVYGRRGGVIGSIATIGVVIGADVPMLIGGMIMGPLGAWIMKKVDKLFEGKVKPGLEMLVDNFSMGIIGTIIMIIGYSAIQPTFTFIMNVFSAGVDALLKANLLPLASIFVQPGQVLFLNNAINHGILAPLGIAQAAELGKSVLFLVEANCGNWLGVTLAFMFFGVGMAKKSAPAAAIIMFVGGIGEVVFPYVLSKPKTILGPILGNMAALFVLIAFNGGAVATPSPGSFLAMMAMTPRGSFFANILAYFLSCAISMAVVAFFLIRDREKDLAMEMEPAMAAAGNVGTVTSSVTTDYSSVAAPSGEIKNIVFACDAGMGSSVMGSSIMKTKINKAMLSATITHASVADIPETADLIVTGSSLEPRVKDVIKKYNKSIPVFSVNNLMNADEYDAIVDYIKNHSK